MLIWFDINVVTLLLIVNYFDELPIKMDVHNFYGGSMLLLLHKNAIIF